MPLPSEDRCWAMILAMSSWENPLPANPGSKWRIMRVSTPVSEVFLQFTYIVSIGRPLDAV